MLRAALTVLLGLVLAAPAAAAKPVKSIWGPATPAAFAHYDKLGVDMLQVLLHWDEAEPAQGAYAWPAQVDDAVRLADAAGIDVSIAVMGAPRWANGGRRWQVAPRDPKPFAGFLRAAASRYESVDHWLIWVEPTKQENFAPLVGDEGKPLRGRRELEGPRRYAALLDAAWVALHGVRSSAKVVGGNTFTTGAVAPLRWLKALRRRNGRRPRVDLWGHNPFSLRRPVLSQEPVGNGYADFGDLDTLARRLDKAGWRSASGRRLRLFLSEYTLPTDQPNHEFNFHVTRKVQADWLRDAYRAARWGRIYTLGYLGLYDESARDDGLEVLRGLLTAGGKRKPAYAAYRQS